MKLGIICTTWFTARQVNNRWLDAFAWSWGVWSPWPAEIAERSHSFTGEVIGGKPVIVHHSEGQTGKPVSVLFRTHMAGRQKDSSGYVHIERKKRRGNDDLQVKELVEYWVQRLKFHLRALTLGHREKVMRAELHYDERITQPWARSQKWAERSQKTELWNKNLSSTETSNCFTIGIKCNDVCSVQNLHGQSLLWSVVVALDTDPTKTGMFECFLQHRLHVITSIHEGIFSKIHELIHSLAKKKWPMWRLMPSAVLWTGVALVDQV